MAMPLHRRDQVGQNSFEAFPTDAIRGLPKDDERHADRIGINPPSRCRRLREDGIDSGEESDRMLAMTAGNGNEFI